MSDTLKCIAHYDVMDDTDQRNTFLAACTKLDYVFDCFQKLNMSVSVLSACGTSGHKPVSGKVKQPRPNLTVELLPHKGRGNKLKNIYAELKFRYDFQRRLMDFVEDGDVVLVYHSLSLMKALQNLKNQKNFQLILEVEEIYGDVSEKSDIAAREYAFFQCADAFIFPSETLNERVNTAHKPYVISHGTYHVEPDYAEMPFDDGRIHCLYAGTLDPRKGGGPMAIETAAYLPENYHMHILGFGNEKELADAKALIEEVSAKAACTLTYDGVLSGEAYLRFLQSCDIGLSTQNPHAAFNDTSFPSKILSYMANGVRVVSVRIPVVERSKVTSLISYYDEQTPQAVAKAIMDVDMSMPYDSRAVIEALDQEFCKDLAMMLNER